MISTLEAAQENLSSSLFDVFVCLFTSSFILLSNLLCTNRWKHKRMPSYFLNFILNYCLFILGDIHQR